jgi:peptide/nickel transport system substrate-binding protein
VIPDAATKSGALQTGEVDFIDQLQFDQAEVLAKQPNITVSMLTKIYNPFFMPPNALYPPLTTSRLGGHWRSRSTDRRICRWHSCGRMGPALPVVFLCGSPSCTTAGSEPFAHPDLARARALLKESDYKGEPVVLLSSHETLFVGIASDYAAQNLREIGLNIDQIESD